MLPTEQESGPPPDDDSPQLMTIAQTARYLGHSDSWLFDRLKTDEFPIRPRRIGNRRLFSRRELDAWLANPASEEWR